MKILEFFRKESRAPLRTFAAMAVVSAFASVLILIVINAGVQHALEQAHSFTSLLAFVLAIGLYAVSQRYLIAESNAEVEKVLLRIRMRIAEKIRRCELEALETIGRSEIYTSLSRETQTISQASTLLVMGLQSAVLILLSGLYLASLSMPAFVTFAVAGVAAFVLHRRNGERFHGSLLRAMERENRLLDTLTHVLDGFSEIKLNPRRGDDLFEHLERVSDSVAALRTDVKTQLARLFVFLQMALYVLVAAMIFVVPRLSETHNEVIVQAAAVMLFLTGPISILAGSMPDFANSRAAIEKLEALEAGLDAVAGRHGGDAGALPALDNIRFEGVGFQFHHTKSERPFTLGPLDLTLERGETLFIVGGNGSGKSTLLRLVTGLYRPDQGSIRLNGEPVTGENLQAYRNLFSAVFSDFHLFDRLYGLQDVEEQRVTALLEEMELAHKTSYRQGEFTTLDLSTGQRKRLAYVVGRLEDRPIYVFDEWAAEQDPEFRKRFYETLLPRLKRRGKTILAVTHDDRYWDAADRILKMEEGRFVEP